MLLSDEERQLPDKDSGQIVHPTLNLPKDMSINPLQSFGKLLLELPTIEGTIGQVQSCLASFIFECSVHDAHILIPEENWCVVLLVIQHSSEVLDCLVNTLHLQQISAGLLPVRLAGNGDGEVVIITI